MRKRDNSNNKVLFEKAPSIPELNRLDSVTLANQQENQMEDIFENILEKKTPQKSTNKSP